MGVLSTVGHVDQCSVYTGHLVLIVFSTLSTLVPLHLTMYLLH